MKPRLLLLPLLLLPSLCLAELSPYQKQVVATFAAAGTEKPLVEAYEATAAGSASEAQRKVIRTSEMIHEDLRLSACVRTALGSELTLEAAVDKIVNAGLGPALIADARKLFGQGEWETGVADGDPLYERAVGAASLLASGSKPQAPGEGGNPLRSLQRRMTLNYYMSAATDGKCKPSPQLKVLLGKTSK